MVTHAAITLLVIGGLVVALYLLLPTTVLSRPPTEPKPPAAIAALPIGRDERAAETLQAHKDNEELRLGLKQVLAGQREMSHKVASIETDRKTQAEAWKQEKDDMLKRLAAKEQARTQPAKTPPAKSGPTAEEQRLKAELARLRQEQAGQPSTPHDATFGRFEVFSPKKDDKGPYPLPPSAARGDIPYLGPGCFAPIEVITGAAPSGRTDKGRPLLTSVVAPFTCPYQLQGSGRDSLETEIPLHGCFAFFAAGGDLANGRVLGEGVVLSCVMPDKAFWESPLKAYLVGADGNDGLFGVVETHESAAVAKAFGLAVLGEVSAAFGLARSKVVITDGRNYGPQPGQSTQTQLLELQRYFLDQARSLAPTIRASRGERGWAVIQEGMALEGLPSQILLTKGR
jgi:hypothetical protein